MKTSLLKLVKISLFFIIGLLFLVIFISHTTTLNYNNYDLVQSDYYNTIVVNSNDNLEDTPLTGITDDSKEFKKNGERYDFDTKVNANSELEMRRDDGRNINSMGELSSNTVHQDDYEYDESQYSILSQKSMMPFKNITTCAYLHVFWSGFCNQYYMFTGMILMAEASNCSQILVHSIRWKDLFGTNQQLRHDLFFDVVHWNSFYPSLPRFVSYEEEVFQDLVVSNPQDVKPDLKWKIDDPYSNGKNPIAIGQKRTDAIMKFYDYTKDVEKERSERLESELLMLRGALRPHPAIRHIMSTFKKDHNMTNMMVLHARIEPDMQAHQMCKEHKVVNITDIVEMLYEKFPNPPVSTVLIILNRAILEKEVNSKNNQNEMASYNLKVLNEIISAGLWGGRVMVVEAGTDLANRSKYPVYSKYSSLVGSIINFFLSLEAEIFLGTIVSSFSTAIISYRFFRGKKQNYFYMPHGLDWTTPPDVKQPPRFAC